MSFEERISRAERNVSGLSVELQRAIGAGIREMDSAWRSATLRASTASSQSEAVATVAAQYEGILRSLFSRELDARSASPEESALLPTSLLEEGPRGEWRMTPQVSRELARDVEAAREAEAQSSRVFGAARYRTLRDDLVNSVAARVLALRTEANRLSDASERALAERSESAGRLRHVADSDLTSRIAALEAARALLPPAMQPWGHICWQSWEPGLTHDSVLLGSFRPQPNLAPGPNHHFGWEAVVPHFVNVRRPLRINYGASDRSRALAILRSVLLRALSCTPPGRLRLSIFDPKGLGESVAPLLELAEYDRELLGGKVWTTTDDLKRVLSELSDHVELVIQKYLRAEFPTIKEFNAQAGDIAEPYRLLVVIDGPTGLDETALLELCKVIENGPRCGVSTILLTDTAVPEPRGASMQSLPPSMELLDLGGRAFDSGPSAVPSELLAGDDGEVPQQIVDRIIERVGTGARSAVSQAVTFETTFEIFVSAALQGKQKGLPDLRGEALAAEPATWWMEDTLESIVSPIGQRAAREAAVLRFDSSNHFGALLVGRPGSGKSTLLHTFLAGVTTLYGPSELELHLIDFKEGVEFKVYAAGGLPHARTVAIESDREFGLSVLESLQSEMASRAELLRGSASKSSLDAFRRTTGQRLPRILLVFDEFQVLFAKNDKLGAAAADVLETLIRQGRGFGIHVLLGSQSLSGMDALGSHVPQLLPVRILMPSSDSDAFKVLGERNTAGATLTSAGDGILNQAGGVVEANERFRGSLITEEARAARVSALRQKADDAGFMRRPIVFEGNAPVSALDTPPAQFADEIRGADRRTLRLRFCVPMALGATGDINLRREPGGNLLLVARDLAFEDRYGFAFSVPRATISNCIVSAVTQGARVEIIDFLPIDEGLEDLSAELLAQGRVTLHRRRGAAATLERIASEVQRRIDADATSEPSVFLVLFGVQRARELDPDAIDYEGPDLAELLTRVLRDGPEVGVHVAVWADSLANLGRRLPSRAMREMSWRVVGQMSADDSASLLGTDAARSLRDQQVIVANEDRDTMRRCTSIGLPPRAWIGALLDQLTSKEPE